MLLKRVGPALARRLRLWWTRLLHPGAAFGTGCDVRARFVLRRQAGACVRFGPRCVLDNDLTIEVSGRLEVGARTIFGHHGTLAARASLIIGEDCLIAELVSIRDHDHRFDALEIPIREQGEVVEPVRIGRNVWIGAKATITKGVTIGDNAIIGANAVVTRDIPANAIAACVPARVLRWRSGAKGEEAA